MDLIAQNKIGKMSQDEDEVSRFLRYKQELNVVVDIDFSNAEENFINNYMPPIQKKQRTVGPAAIRGRPKPKDSGKQEDSKPKTIGKNEPPLVTRNPPETQKQEYSKPKTTSKNERPLVKKNADIVFLYKLSLRTA